jgi:hypothetical protein
MADLFRIVKGGPVQEVHEQPFESEVADMQEFVFRNPRLLGDGMEIVEREVNTGPAGRIDLLGIERVPGSGQVVVVELKNVPAGVQVLLQALRYAMWALGNPDSIRLLLERHGIKGDDIDLKPKIMIVAPTVQDDLVELSQFVSSFDFEFMEVRRFARDGEFFVVRTRKAPVGVPTVQVSAQEEWGWEKYASEHKWRSEKSSSATWTNSFRRRVGPYPFASESHTWPIS